MGIMKFAVDGGTEPLTAIQGNDKRLEDATTYTKGIVELYGDIPGDFDMLFLVLADRHLISLIKQDIGSHQHRI